MADKASFAINIESNGAAKAVNDIQQVARVIQKTKDGVTTITEYTRSQTAAIQNFTQKTVSAQSGLSVKTVAIGNFIASGMMKAAAAVKSFLSDSVALYGVQEQAEAKLGAALKATGYAAGYTQKQLEDYASELQNITTYGDEVTLQSMTMLAAFKNIKGDHFKAAQLAAMDMAAAMGKSLPEATKLFGASLNNPIEGISKLKESGIQFTKAQIAEITRLTNTGRTAEAQAIILAEAQARWGGAAAAAAQTATGQMQQVVNAAGDIKESLGGILLNVFTLGGAGNWLSQTCGQWSGYLKENMNQISYTSASVALKIAAFAEKINVVFEPVWTTIAAGIKNIVLMGQWLYDNWSKIWVNLGDIALAVGKDLLNGFLAIPKILITTFKELGSAIWDMIMNPSEAGERLSQMLSKIGDKAVKEIAGMGRNTAVALAKAGVSALPEFGTGDYTGWTNPGKRWAEIDKKYAGYQAALDKGLAAAEDARKSKSLTPPEIRNAQAAEAAKAEQKKFAGIAEKGSNEAWKTILANQKTKPEIAVAEKQLEAQNQIRESVDKVTAAVKETANQSPVRKTDTQSAERAAKGDSYTRAQSKKTATPEKQLKVTEEIRDILKEISKGETIGAYAI